MQAWIVHGQAGHLHGLAEIPDKWIEMEDTEKMRNSDRDAILCVQSVSSL